MDPQAAGTGTGTRLKQSAQARLSLIACLTTINSIIVHVISLRHLLVAKADHSSGKYVNLSQLKIGGHAGHSMHKLP